MTYLSDKSKKKHRLLRTGLLLVVVLVLCVSWPVTRLALYPYAETVLTSLRSGYVYGMSWPHDIVGYFTSRQTYEARIAALEAHTEELENNLIFRDTSEVSGTSTRIHMQPPHATVLFPLAQDYSRLYTDVILSRGFSDDIQEGVLVYIRGRQVICRVSEVHARTSLCTLLSHHGNSVEGVVVKEEMSESITLLGDGGGTFIATIPKESQIAVGDVVRYKGDQTMVLGTVADIKKDAQGVFMHVYVRGAYNPVTATRMYVDTH